MREMFTVRLVEKKTCSMIRDLDACFRTQAQGFPCVGELKQTHHLRHVSTYKWVKCIKLSSITRRRSKHNEYHNQKRFKTVRYLNQKGLGVHTCIIPWVCEAAVEFTTDHCWLTVSSLSSTTINCKNMNHLFQFKMKHKRIQNLRQIDKELILMTETSINWDEFTECQK